MKFTNTHKKLAKKGYPYLQENYYRSEENLKRACKSGNKKAMSKAMEEHQVFEYALLYRQTPEFRQNLKTNNEKGLRSQIILPRGEKAYMIKMKQNY